MWWFFLGVGGMAAFIFAAWAWAMGLFPPRPP
jgi:hypothetical protein